MQMSDKRTPQTSEETETFINNSWKRIFQLLVYYLIIISYLGTKNQYESSRVGSVWALLLATMALVVGSNGKLCSYMQLGDQA